LAKSGGSKRGPKVTERGPQNKQDRAIPKIVYPVENTKNASGRIPKEHIVDDFVVRKLLLWPKRTTSSYSRTTSPVRAKPFNISELMDQPGHYKLLAEYHCRL
jgi:hypothetical protein